MIPQDANRPTRPLEAVIRHELVHVETHLPSEADGGVDILGGRRVGESPYEVLESEEEADVAAAVPVALAEAVEEDGHVVGAVVGEVVCHLGDALLGGAGEPLVGVYFPLSEKAGGVG